MYKPVLMNKVAITPNGMSRLASDTYEIQAAEGEPAPKKKNPTRIVCKNTNLLSKCGHSIKANVSKEHLRSSRKHTVQAEREVACARTKDKRFQQINKAIHIYAYVWA